MGAHKQSPVRGLIFKYDLYGDDVHELGFQFNPNSLRRKRGVGWTLTTPPGGTLPIPMYGQAQVETLGFQAFLDSRETDDGTQQRDGVINQLAFFESLTEGVVINADDPDTEFVAPPICRLIFGPRDWLVVVNDISIEETMFDTGLRPIRATVDVQCSIVFTGVENRLNARNLMLSRLRASEQVSSYQGEDNPVAGDASDLTPEELAIFEAL
jgi:hypothetical protein